MPAVERFWARVRKTSSCWLWEGYSANGRYGHMNVDGERVGAHIFSYVLHHGPVPAGLKVLHKCDNGFCVRPSHLFAGTQKQNVADMFRKGRADRKASAAKMWRRLKCVGH